MPTPPRHNIPHQHLSATSRTFIPLRLINIILCLDLPDPNLHALLAKTDVFLLHLLRCLVCDIRCDCVDRIADECSESEDYEQNEEGEKLREDHGGVGWWVEARAVASCADVDLRREVGGDIEQVDYLKSEAMCMLGKCGVLGYNRCVMQEKGAHSPEVHKVIRYILEGWAQG